MNNPLKFSESSPPGRRFTDHIASFRSGDVELKQGVFNTGGYCTLCGITCPHHHDKVTCAICRRVYHTPCLPDKLGRSTVATLSRNPSLWWFCLECLHVTNSADVSRGGPDHGVLSVSDVSLSGSNSSFVSETDLQDHLTVMESKIYSRLKLELDESLSKIVLSDQSLSSSCTSVNAMFPDFPAGKELKESVLNPSAINELSDRSKKFSSSSGFSESQGSSPSEQNVSQNSQGDSTKCFFHSKKIEASRTTEPSRNSQPSRKVENPRKLKIPEIPKVICTRKSDVARVLSPNKSERRKKNTDDLNAIKNLVQKGRNLDII